MSNDLSRLVGELKSLLAKATPRPWCAVFKEAEREAGIERLYIHEEFEDDPEIVIVGDHGNASANADLICDLANGAEALLDAASESATLRAENERLRTRLAGFLECSDCGSPLVCSVNGCGDTVPPADRDRVAKMEAEIDRLRALLAEKGRHGK